MKNRLKISAYHAAYHAAFPEKARERLARWRSVLAGAPINDFTTADWLDILKTCGYRCVYCGKKSKKLTRDHLTPLAHGGSHTKSNILPSCGTCNRKKSTHGVLKPVQPLLL